MTKTFNISCDIDLFNAFKQLISNRNEKVSTVIAAFMQSEIDQDKRNYDLLVDRIIALEETVSDLVKDRR